MKNSLGERGIEHGGHVRLVKTREGGSTPLPLYQEAHKIAGNCGDERQDQ